ncbi:hypothetical protein DLE60_18630, partial [Micromonospora globispora]
MASSSPPRPATSTAARPRAGPRPSWTPASRCANWSHPGPPTPRPAARSGSSCAAGTPAPRPPAGTRWPGGRRTTPARPCPASVY